MYKKSDNDTFAYDCVEDLWQVELDENEDDSDFIINDNQVCDDNVFDESSDSATSTVKSAQIGPKRLVDLTEIDTDDEDGIPKFTPTPAWKCR